MRVVRCFLLAVAVVLLAGGLPVRAEDAAADRTTPQETLRRFYAWYVPALAGGEDLLAAGRRGELRRYVSGRFLGRIDRARRGPDGLDGDPFLDAQDFDPQWGKQIAVRVIETREERVEAEVTLTGKELGVKRLHVILAREDGTWKLDHVGGRE